MNNAWRGRARQVAPYVVLAAIAAVPAFYALGERGFWGDEVWTVWWSRLFGWRGILAQFDAPPDLPLSFWITRAANLLGESTFASRLPSALMGIGSVLLLFHIGRRQLGAWTGFGAALLLAIAPFHVWYEQEARPYAALEFLSLLSLAFFLRLLAKPGPFAVIGFAIASAAVIYDHFFGLFPVAVLFLVGLGLVAIRWFGRRVAAGVLAAAAMTLVLLLPILPGLIGYGFDQSGGQVPEAAVSLDSIQLLLASFGAGQGWPTVVLTLLFVVGIGAAIRARQPIGLIAPAWIVLPLLVVYVASPEHGLITRYVLFMLPIYLLMVVNGLYVTVGGAQSFVARRTSREVPRASLVSSLLLAAMLIFMLPLTASSTMALRGTDWSGMCEYLRVNAKAGDVIIGSQYYSAAMSWCFDENSSSVVVTTGNRYTAADVVASGRPSWYVQIDIEPMDPAVAALGYTQVAQALIERPGTRHEDPRIQFPYQISENRSRLFRGPATNPPSSIVFHDHAGEHVSPDWPDYANVSRRGGLVFDLSSGRSTGQALTLGYVDGPERATVVLVDGREVARLEPIAAADNWTTATIPLPATSAPVITVEVQAAGAKRSAISSAAIQ